MADEHVVHTSGDNGMGFLLGIIVLVIFVFFLFYYGLPAMRQGGGGTQINVPDQIDVNTNSTTQ